MNEAAFDPTNDLLPSLGQNMGSYNILTNSILRQSQIGDLKMESMDSAIGMAASHESVEEHEASAAAENYPEVNLFENDQTQNTAIKKIRFSKYRLNHPGFFTTFENQAEVYEMLVHEEIQ